MEKTIKIISTENVPVEDLFSGNYSAHEVKGLPDTYAVIKEPRPVVWAGDPNFNSTSKIDHTISALTTQTTGGVRSI